MTTDPAIAPVGHLHGRIGQSARIRLGTQTLELDELEYAAWLLAHGVDEIGPQLLTAAALGTLLDDPAPLDRLWDRGLLVEVPNDPAAFGAFADSYRLVPLVHGLGNAHRSAAFAIGLPDGDRELSGPWAELNTAGFELWRRSAAHRSVSETVAAIVAGAEQSVLREGLGGAEEAGLREYAITLLGPLLTGWTAALQPASTTPVVPASGRPVLPPPEPVDPFTALDPEEILHLPWHPERPDSLVAQSPRWQAEPGHPGAAGWLFAVGHGGGPFHRWYDHSYVGHLVRIGADDHTLDEGEARLWELTRAAKRSELCTRTSVAAAAVGEGVPDAARRLDGLIERGLIVEVHPGTGRAAAFARAYRLLPLVHGLGEAIRDATLFDYGIPGRHRVTVTTAQTALLWRTAGQWPSLEGAVTAIAGSYAAAGQSDLREDTPDDYLTYWGFAGIRELLSYGVTYLDLAP